MKRAVGVSDIHCGSWWGLLPPDFLTFEGIPKSQRSGQKYLWECWLDACNRIGKFDPDYVFCNGDLIDGLQDKQKGAELSLSNWKDQREAAIQTLQVLRSATKRAKWLHTAGTPYHVGNFGEAEEDIAEAMRATKYPGLGMGLLCKEVAKIKVKGEGCIIEAAHHVSLASLYRGTPLEKEWKGAELAEDPPDLMIRSHGHTYTNFERHGMRVVMTPCWQLQSRHARKPGVHILTPHLGFIYIEIHGRRSEVWEERYKNPKIPIAEL